MPGQQNISRGSNHVPLDAARIKRMLQQPFKIIYAISLYIVRIYPYGFFPSIPSLPPDILFSSKLADAKVRENKTLTKCIGKSSFSREFV